VCSKGIGKQVMQKRQILINAAMSVIQIVAVGVVLFVLYKFLLRTIGVEQLGIWSLVLATSSIAHISNFGFSGSVVKYVAKYLARGEGKRVSDVIQTAVISIALFAGCFLVVIYPLVKWVLRLVIEDGSLPLAVSILPPAFLALWIMIVTEIYQSGLDGCQRIDIRSAIGITGAVIHLLLSFLLAPTFGLMGLAYAQIARNLIVLFLTIFLLKRYLRSLPVIPHHWDKDIFKETIVYGINFQLISFIAMLYDPLIKTFLSKFGGLSFIGYYEMASRMIQQLRALIVSANQVLVPAIADLQEKAPEKIRSVYLTSYQLIFYLALPFYSIVVVCMPLISRLWIGHYEGAFVISGILLSVGWFMNTIAGPAYFSYLGTGSLRWNLTGHLLIAFLNVGLGLPVGISYGGIGVIVAWAVSLSLGSSIIYLSYHISNKIQFRELIPVASRPMMVVCLAGILLNYSAQFTVNIILFILFLVVIIITAWVHPMRKRLMGWINSQLLNTV
jgi:O-antigen/teichoic acid export membrane protein